MIDQSRQMNVLVLGATGFVGRHTTPLLVDAGWQVTCLTRSESSAKVVREMGADSVHGDLDDAASLERAFEEVNCRVMLCIASLGFGHAPTIIGAAQRAGIDRAVFVSTTAIFTGLNAPTKSVRIAAEDAIASSNLDFTIVRPTMIYGAHDDRNIARLIAALSSTAVFPIPGGGRRLQQPIHVDDVATALVQVLGTPGLSRESFNVAGPEAMTFRSLVSRVAAAMGKRRLLVPVPLAPIIGLVRLYEHLSRHPRIKAEQFERLSEDKVFDNAPAIDAFGFSPRSFDTGIRQEIADISRHKSVGPPVSREQ